MSVTDSDVPMVSVAGGQLLEPNPRGRDRVSTVHRRRNLVLGILVCALVAAATLVPVLFVLVNSFNAAGIGTTFEFTLRGWQELFNSPKTVESIGYTFLLSLRIPIGLAIAFMISWLMVRVDLPARKFIETSLWVAFFIPTLSVTLGWVLLANGDYGLINEVWQMLPFATGPLLSINSIPGIMWVHLTISTIPIMVILLSPALRQFDASYEEAADVSGAGVGVTLRRITLPLLAPAILTAFIAGLIKSLEAFEVEQILGTPVGIEVYANRLFEVLQADPPDYTGAMALGSLFLVVLLIAAIAYQIVLRKLNAQATMTGRGVSLTPRARTRSTYWLSALLIVGISIGIFLPLVTLLVGSFNKIFGFFFIPQPWTTAHWTTVFTDGAFLQSVSNSLVVGLIAAAVGTVLYSLLAWVMVRSNIRGKGILNVLVWLPWAIPGILMGIALLWIFLSVPGPKLLYGSLAPLIIAIIIKEVPLCTQMLRTALHQIGPELEEAADVAGATFFTKFRRVTLPLIAPMLITVFMLVFIATLRDVSSVVFLAPAGTQTLPLLMFDYANGGAMESGAVIGVVITGIALALVLIAQRLGLQMNPNRK